MVSIEPDLFIKLSGISQYAVAVLEILAISGSN